MSGRAAVVRTCVGCRQRVAIAELVRVVARPEPHGAGSGDDTAYRVTLDPHHRLPGRGAWLHRDPECVGLAIRRRVFARALRLSAPVVLDDVVAFREQCDNTGSHTNTDVRSINHEYTMKSPA